MHKMNQRSAGIPETAPISQLPSFHEWFPSEEKPVLSIHGHWTTAKTAAQSVVDFQHYYRSFLLSKSSWPFLNPIRPRAWLNYDFGNTGPLLVVFQTPQPLPDRKVSDTRSYVATPEHFRTAGGRRRLGSPIVSQCGGKLCCVRKLCRAPAAWNEGTWDNMQVG